MKKIVLILSFCLAASVLAAQTPKAPQVPETWKLIPVWSEKYVTYLSFGLPDGDDSGETGLEEPFFSLWGYHSYDEKSLNSFEVEYFRGSPSEMRRFLEHVADFSEKYKSGMAESRIYGVKIKTLVNPVFGTYTCVYGPDGRELCMYKAKQWAAVYDDFTKFCSENSVEMK